MFILMCSFGLNSTNLNGPVPIGCCRIWSGCAAAFVRPRHALPRHRAGKTRDVTASRAASPRPAALVRYTNRFGDSVHQPSPGISGYQPEAPSATCRDSSSSFGRHRNGTCSVTAVSQAGVKGEATLMPDNLHQSERSKKRCAAHIRARAAFSRLSAIAAGGRVDKKCALQ